MKCKLCEEFYRKYPLIKNESPVGESDRMHHKITDCYYSAPVECAFESGEFSHNNWSCKTLHELRDMSGENFDDEATELGSFHWRDDMGKASIGVVPIPEDCNHQSGYIVMTWYKSRGRTGQAWVMWDDDKPELLTMATAEFVINHNYMVLT